MFKSSSSTQWQGVLRRLRGGLPSKGSDTALPAAQTLPEDILVYIFTIVTLEFASEGWQALLACTFVCRSWSQPSSATVLRNIGYWWHVPSKLRRVTVLELPTVKSDFTRSTPTATHPNGDGQKSIGQLSDAISRFPRPSARICELDIRADMLARVCSAIATRGTIFGLLSIFNIFTLYRFLSTHSKSLAPCELHLSFRLSRNAEAEAEVELGRELDDNLNVPSRPLLILAACPNLRSLHLEWYVQFTRPVSASIVCGLLNWPFADIAAAPAPQTHFLGLQLTSRSIAEMAGDARLGMMST